MDYETKPTSRDDLRRYAIYFRKLFDVPETGPFPVLEALDKISDVFEGSNYIIVEDDQLPPHTHHGYEHNENDSSKGFAHLTPQEKEMVGLINKVWREKKKDVWSRWKKRK